MPTYTIVAKLSCSPIVMRAAISRIKRELQKKKYRDLILLHYIGVQGAEE